MKYITDKIKKPYVCSNNDDDDSGYQMDVLDTGDKETVDFILNMFNFDAMEIGKEYYSFDKIIKKEYESMLDGIEIISSRYYEWYFNFIDKNKKYEEFSFNYNDVIDEFSKKNIFLKVYYSTFEKQEVINEVNKDYKEITTITQEKRFGFLIKDIDDIIFFDSIRKNNNNNHHYVSLKDKWCFVKIV